MSTRLGFVDIYYLIIFSGTQFSPMAAVREGSVYNDECHR